jgi:DNA-binding LacI/PurR family transcriptional regulator
MANRKDVALKANVSITVVSRVMSNMGYVSQEKREAVLRAAEELNYRPSPVARSLQNGQTRQILFYRGYISSAYYVVITIIPSIAVYIVLHEKIIHGMTAGAVKG